MVSAGAALFTAEASAALQRPLACRAGAFRPSIVSAALEGFKAAAGEPTSVDAAAAIAERFRIAPSVDPIERPSPGHGRAAPFAPPGEIGEGALWVSSYDA
jgi:hypothetical protein